MFVFIEPYTVVKYLFLPHFHLNFFQLTAPLITSTPQLLVYFVFQLLTYTQWETEPSPAMFQCSGIPVYFLCLLCKAL